MILTYKPGAKEPGITCERVEGTFEKTLDAHVFTWNNINHISKLSIGSFHEFVLYFEPKFFWKKVLLDSFPVTNACTETKLHKIQEGWMTITYRGQKKYDKEHGGNMFEMALLNVTVGIYQFPDFFSRFQQLESHQIFALLKVDRGHTVMLGRAQSIETLVMHNTRIYKWFSFKTLKKSDEAIFPGVSRHHSLEELHMMEQMKQGPLLSARHLKPTVEMEFDHDGFSNSKMVLPIVIPQDAQTLKLQIFNAKFKPAPFVETSIRLGFTLQSNDNQKQKRRTSKLFQRRKSKVEEEQEEKEENKRIVIKEDLSDYISYELHICNNSIVELVMFAREYHFSLDSLGRFLVLKSI